MKILVAEDNATFRLILGGLLRKLGHEVVAVGTGLEALAELRREYFPVLITDWQMPEMDGMALTRLVRANPRDKYTYVVLLTAHGGDENYLEGIKAGADDFLVKPPDEKHLAARLLVAERVVGVQDHVKRLEALMAVCSYCKNVREEGNRWVAIERYVAKRMGIRSSHGICPECWTTRVKPELERLGIAGEEMPSP